MPPVAPSDAPPTVVDESGNVVVPLDPDAAPTPSGNVSELASAKSRRQMRMAAFVAFTMISSLYFFVLLGTLCYWLTHKDSLWLLGRLQHQSALLIGGALVIFASIPLSLTLAMVRLAQDPQAKEEKAEATASIASITTPGLEAIKTIAEALKNVTGKT
jgi:uncharacterized Tic20 family protein